MEATDQIDRLIESRRQGREEANALEAIWAASERRVLEKRREENKIAWIAHYRGLTAAHLKMALDCRRRAREMQATEVKETV